MPQAQVEKVVDPGILAPRKFFGNQISQKIFLVPARLQSKKCSTEKKKRRENFCRSSRHKKISAEVLGRRKFLQKIQAEHFFRKNLHCLSHRLKKWSFLGSQLPEKNLEIRLCRKIFSGSIQVQSKKCSKEKKEWKISVQAEEKINEEFLDRR